MDNIPLALLVVSGKVSGKGCHADFVMGKDYQSKLDRSGHKCSLFYNFSK